MLVKNLKQFVDIVKANGTKTWFTGQSGSGKTLTKLISEEVGVKPFVDIDSFGTQVRYGSNPWFDDSGKWQGLYDEKKNTYRVYRQYGDFGIVFKLFMPEGERLHAKSKPWQELATVKIWHLKDSSMERTVSFWNTKTPVEQKVTDQLVEIAKANPLATRIQFGQAFDSSLWVVDAAKIAKTTQSSIVGTCNNKINLLEAYKPKKIIFLNLEYELQRRVWDAKAKAITGFELGFQEMAGLSRSQVERESQRRVDIFRALSVPFKFQVEHYTLADFGIPLKNAWSGEDERAWIKRKLGGTK